MQANRPFLSCLLPPFQNESLIVQNHSNEDYFDLMDVHMKHIFIHLEWFCMKTCFDPLAQENSKTSLAIRLSCSCPKQMIMKPVHIILLVVRVKYSIEILRMCLGSYNTVIWPYCFIFPDLGGSNLDALKTAASSGNLDPPAVASDTSLGRRRLSVEWYKNQLTFKLRIRDPLITKQSEYQQDQLF